MSDQHLIGCLPHTPVSGMQGPLDESESTLGLVRYLGALVLPCER